MQVTLFLKIEGIGLIQSYATRNSCCVALREAAATIIMQALTLHFLISI